MIPVRFEYDGKSLAYVKLTVAPREYEIVNINGTDYEVIDVEHRMTIPEGYVQNPSLVEETLICTLEKVED